MSTINPEIIITDKLSIGGLFSVSFRLPKHPLVIIAAFNNSKETLKLTVSTANENDLGSIIVPYRRQTFVSKRQLVDLIVKSGLSEKLKDRPEVGILLNRLDLQSSRCIDKSEGYDKNLDNLLSELYGYVTALVKDNDDSKLNINLDKSEPQICVLGVSSNMTDKTLAIELHSKDNVFILRLYSPLFQRPVHTITIPYNFTTPPSLKRLHSTLSTLFDELDKSKAEYPSVALAHLLGLVLNPNPNVFLTALDWCQQEYENFNSVKQQVTGVPADGMSKEARETHALLKNIACQIVITNKLLQKSTKVPETNLVSSGLIQELSGIRVKLTSPTEIELLDALINFSKIALTK